MVQRLLALGLAVCALGCSIDVPVGRADALLAPVESDIAVGSRQDLVATACQERLTLSLRASAASAVTAAALTALGRVDALFYAAEVNAGLRCRSVGEVQGITMPSNTAFTLEQSDFVHTATVVAGAEGEVLLTGTVDNDGESLTATAIVRAHVPDALRSTVRCVDGGTGPSGLVPSGALVEVDLEVRAGAVVLGGYGYRAPLDVIGAAIQERREDDVRRVVVEIPAGGGAATLTSPIDDTFLVELEGYDVAQIDGVSAEGVPALQRVGERAFLTFAPMVAGERPCLYASDIPVFSAMSETPDVCTVTSTTSVPGPAVVTATPVSGGRCRVRGEYDGIASRTVEFEVRGFEVVPLPAIEPGHSLDLRAMWASSAASVYVLGEDRDGSGPNITTRLQQVLHYDGASWTTTPTDVALAAIHGTSDTSVYAVGPMGTILHHDGGDWSPMASGTDVSLVTVFTTPDGWTLAGGQSGTLLELTMTGWETVTLPVTIAQPISEIWGNAADNVYVGTAQGLLLRFDGSQWTEIDHPLAGVGAIFGFGPNELYVGGTSLQRYDGSTWTELFSLPDGIVYDLWGSSGDDLFAIGYAGNSVGAPFARSNDSGDWAELELDQSGGTGRQVLGFAADDAVLALTNRALLIYPR